MSSLSSVTYTGNGSMIVFTIPFAYLSRSDIFVFVNGVSVPFTFVNTATLRCTTPPPAGTLVLVRRMTQKLSSPVDFKDGSVLLETDLDTLALYSLYTAQESSDQDGRLLALENALLSVGGIGEGPQVGAVYIQRLSADGLTTAFLLNATAQSTTTVDVFIGGIYQNHDTFAINGASIFFSEAPPEGTQHIELRFYTQATVYYQSLSGDGETVAFALSAAPASALNVDVYISGTYQQHDTFSVVGALITFSEAPPPGANNVELKFTT